MVPKATSPSLPVHTPRLRLRPFHPHHDVHAFHAYRSLPEVCRYAPIEPLDLDRAKERLHEAAHTRSRLVSEGDVLWLAVEHQASGHLVGDVSLTWHSHAHRLAEMGCTIHPQHNRRGYAAEAAQALLGLAFGGYGFHRVIARIDNRNRASLSAAQKVGMRQEATSRECQWLKGEWVTLTEWAILEQEWPPPHDEPRRAPSQPMENSWRVDVSRELARWRIG